MSPEVRLTEIVAVLEAKVKQRKHMTEAQWLACTSPKQMLAYLRCRVNDRKLRLFAVACCGRLAPLLDDPRSVAAVEVAEQYADGLATEEQRTAAARSAQQVCARFLRSRTRPAAGDYARQEACSAATATTITRALLAARRTSEYAAEAGRLAGMKGRSDYQTSLLRDIFGNPFRQAVLPSSLQTWNGGTIGRLAASIYEERAFDRLPILADALEDAGCMDADILGHCRSAGEHVRGCWIVDLLLGKE
jgi:hypothetical protein